MLSPRWMKLVRDIEQIPGRLAMMVLAIAAGVFGLGTMLSSYTILSREIPRNYLDTNPAAAMLRLNRVDADLIKSVRAFPGIAAAQADSVVGATIMDISGSGQPLTLFVVEDFNQLPINTIYREAGAWPPPAGTILLERDALKTMRAKIGDSLQIKAADGKTRQVLVSGTTHDPGMPVPSMAIFAYATQDTVAAMGFDASLHNLKITVKDKPFDIDAIENTVSQLVKQISQQGATVELIRVPPPGKHPHEVIMTSVLGMLLLFSFIALILSAVLTATILDGMLAQQVRQIGVMKAIGASTSQIAGLYLTFVLMVGVVATAIGAPAGLAAGRAFSSVVLVNLLNFTLHSGEVPHYVYLVLLGAGLLIPAGLAAIPILKATRISVHDAISDVGTDNHVVSAQQFGGWLDRLPGIDRSLIMALRNSLRRRGRLLLTLALMAAAGAMFISSLNVRKASGQYMVEAAADRHYDLEIVMSQPEVSQDLLRIMQSVPGVHQAEAWHSTAAARQRGDGPAIERTYPDGGHGTLSLATIPADSQTLKLTMLSGSWLAAGDSDTVVLNHAAASDFYPDAKVGDPIGVSVRGKTTQLKLIGIARQNMTSAIAYVAPATYLRMAGPMERSSTFRIITDGHEGGTIDRVARQVEVTLEKQAMRPRLSITESMLRKAGDSHFDLLIGALLFISVLMAVVGVLGLSSAMGTNVAERSREFGIMRSIGASSGVVLRNVLAEGMLIGLMSWVIAVMVALPLSAGIGTFVGNLLFDMPFPLVMSYNAIFIWLLIVAAGSIAASAYPAWKTSRLTIRETLAYL